MIDPLYLVFFVVLLLIMAVLVPKALRGQTSEADSLFTTALLKKQSGSLSEAEYYLQRALSAFESEKSPDFGKMCGCLVVLAECLSRSEKYEESRQLYAKLIDLWNSGISKDNPEIYLDIDYLASTANFGAGTSEVADCYAKIIQAKKRVFGQNHPDVANSLKIYALLLRRLGREADAQEAEGQAANLIENKEHRDGGA
jgi:tetratricopeptide (TPR) repeat protein